MGSSQHWHRTAFRRTKQFSPRTPEQRSAFGRTPFGRTKHRTPNNPIPNTEHRTRLESIDLLRQPNAKQAFSLNTEQKRSPNNAFDSEHVQMPEPLPEHRTAFSEHRTAFGDSPAYLNHRSPGYPRQVKREVTQRPDCK